METPLHPVPEPSAPLLTYDQFVSLYEAGDPAALWAIIQTLQERLGLLRQDFDKMAQQAHRNSQNSSQPPSSDGYRKPPPKSQRHSSGKKVGGQPGHPGHTLMPVETPDTIQVHAVSTCAHCGVSLTDQPPQAVQRRQVFDLPPQRLHVTEHQAESKKCPACHQRTTAAFPSGVEAPTQYGPTVMALAVYFNHFQLVPFARLREVFRDLWDVSLSAGPLLRSSRFVAQKLAPITESIRVALQTEPVVNTDETGMRVMRHLYWFHTVSTPLLTFLFAHPKRGRDAINAMDILPHREGTTVHDGLSTYDAYPGTPARCNAHHGRELTAVTEATQQSWAADLQSLLGEMKEATDSARAAGEAQVDPALQAVLRTRYDDLIRTGLAENPAVEPPPGRRRRPAQSFTRNLLERLDTKRDAVLCFLGDLAVPFDNNWAERDFRMVKVKQKVSGTFRTEDGATGFATIRGYLSTARKQGQSMLAVLRSVIEGKPWQPLT